MKKNVGDLKMSLKQARKLYVLERLCDGRISNGEAASDLNLSVRQTQRVKLRFSELGPESLVHGNTGGKPPNYVADHIRDFVALQAMTRWEGASSSHMSELLYASSRRGRLAPVPSYHRTCGSASGGSPSLTKVRVAFG